MALTLTQGIDFDNINDVPGSSASITYDPDGNWSGTPLIQGAGPIVETGRLAYRGVRAHDSKGPFKASLYDKDDNLISSLEHKTKDAENFILVTLQPQVSEVDIGSHSQRIYWGVSDVSFSTGKVVFEFHGMANKDGANIFEVSDQQGTSWSVFPKGGGSYEVVYNFTVADI